MGIRNSLLIPYFDTNIVHNDDIPEVGSEEISEFLLLADDEVTVL